MIDYKNSGTKRECRERMPGIRVLPAYEICIVNSKNKLDFDSFYNKIPI